MRLNDLDVKTFIPRNKKEAEKLRLALRNYRSVKCVSPILVGQRANIVGKKKSLSYFERVVLN